MLSESICASLCSIKTSWTYSVSLASFLDFFAEDLSAFLSAVFLFVYFLFVRGASVVPSALFSEPVSFAVSSLVSSLAATTSDSASASLLTASFSTTS